MKIIVILVVVALTGCLNRSPKLKHIKVQVESYSPINDPASFRIKPTNKRYNVSLLQSNFVLKNGAELDKFIARNLPLIDTNKIVLNVAGEKIKTELPPLTAILKKNQLTHYYIDKRENF